MNWLYAMKNIHTILSIHPSANKKQKRRTTTKIITRKKEKNKVKHKENYEGKMRKIHKTRKIKCRDAISKTILYGSHFVLCMLFEGRWGAVNAHFLSSFPCYLSVGRLCFVFVCVRVFEFGAKMCMFFHPNNSMKHTKFTHIHFLVITCEMVCVNIY